MEEIELEIADILALIEEKKYAKVKAKLVELNVVDIATILEEVEKTDEIKIFRLLSKDLAAEVFAYLPYDISQRIIESITDKEIGNIINDLYYDDAADLIEEMPANVVKRILLNANEMTRKTLNQLLNYPDDSAGSLMTTEYVDLHPDLDVTAALQRIRKQGVDKETINTCYVLDNQRKLLGFVTLRRILLSPENVLISEIMSEHTNEVNTLTDQEEVAHIFSKYDVTALPVVDNEGRMVGIITIDDIVDIIQEEATEDIEKMAAMIPSDKPYLKMGVFEAVKQRLPWLLILMISATFTGKIIQGYEDALKSAVILTAFIPMLMDSGGNCGSQASVSIIRGLALNEIKFKDLPSILFKEFRISIIIGTSLAILNCIKMITIDQTSLSIAVVVSLTLLCTVILAKLVGTLLPMIADRFGLDPAVMASPLITTIVDALSLFIYFNIASILLNL